MKYIYISSCRNDGGIYKYRLDASGITYESFTPIKKPMYTVISDRKMYVLLKQPFDNSPDSGLVVFDIGENGNIANHTQVISTDGQTACHLTVLDGRVYCTNYSSGSIAEIGGRLVTHSGKGIHPERQKTAHTHCVLPTPDNKFLCVTDLGLDKIFVYDKSLNLVSITAVPAGSGVRHIVFSDDGKKCFAVNELNATICAFDYKSGNLALRHTASALPHDFKGESFGAAIRYKNGRIYTSNRGHDSISIFEYKEDTLTLVSNFYCGGHWPRDFDIIDNILFCANEYSNTVTLFKNHNGTFQKLDTVLDIPSPLCVTAFFKT